METSTERIPRNSPLSKFNSNINELQRITTKLKAAHLYDDQKIRLLKIASYYVFSSLAISERALRQFEELPRDVQLSYKHQILIRVLVKLKERRVCFILHFSERTKYSIYGEIVDILKASNHYYRRVFTTWCRLNKIKPRLTQLPLPYMCVPFRPILFKPH